MVATCHIDTTHSYIRRVGEYMDSSGRRNLMLSGIDVTVIGYSRTKSWKVHGEQQPS